MMIQEFMFACAMMPRDTAFLENVAEEVRYQVRRLMSYPAVAIWSGNNENEAALDWFPVSRAHRDRYVVDQVKLYVDTIRDTLLQADSTRPFVFSSPSNGPLVEDPYVLRWGNSQSPLWGDVHYYNYLDDCTNLTLIPPARFMSEYGFQSFDSFPTLSPTLDPSLGDANYNSPLMNWRQHHDNGTNQIIYQAQLHFKYTPQNKTLEDFKKFIYISQTMQTHCIRTWAEFLRRGRDMPQKTQGSIYWQLNQIWPAPSWASIESSGRWKMLHYAAKQFYAPLIVSSFESTPGAVTIYVTSDSTQVFTGSLLVTIEPWSSSQSSSSMTFPVKIAPLASFVYQFQVPADVARKSNFVLLQVTAGNDEIARNVHYLTKLKDASLQAPQITASAFQQPDNSTITFALSASNSAPYVWLETSYSGRFSDNGFLLLSSERATLTFRASTGTTISLETFKSTLSIKSLYDSN
jgi:beta-mannosidase